jgi:adenosine deaminase
MNAHPQSAEQEARFQAMPKVELHCHLEGCVRPQTFIELAARHGVTLPTADPAHVYDYHDMASFMVVFERLCASVVDHDDMARITYEALVDGAAWGVVYREMFVNPTLHPTLTYPEFTSALAEGAARARSESGIVTRFIPSIYRGHSPAVATTMARDVVAHPHELVVGFGMDGDELAGAPEDFVEAYQIAASGGLGLTAHAGERFDAAELRTCLDLLGCTRIDHGYALTRNPELLTRVLDEDIHVTCALLSTTYNYDGPLADHPIRALQQAGVSMSLGSDDPAMGGTDMGGDYSTLARDLGFTEADLVGQNRAALEASWLTGPDRDEVRSRLW